MAQEATHVHESSSGMGFFLGVLVLLLGLFLFFYYGLPAIQNSGANSGNPQINVPEQVDVNVNNGGEAGSGTQQ